MQAKIKEHFIPPSGFSPTHIPFLLSLLTSLSPSHIHLSAGIGLCLFCHWLRSTRVRTVKFTWCPVGMLIWQSSRSSLFFFFKFSLKSMTECWLLLGSCRCDRYFFVKSPFSVQSPTPKMSSMWNGSGDMGDPLLASHSCYFKPEAHGQERQSV